MAHVDLLYKRVKEYLDSQDWKYTTHDEKHIIDFGMNIDCKLKSARSLSNARTGRFPATPSARSTPTRIPARWWPNI